MNTKKRKISDKTEKKDKQFSKPTSDISEYGYIPLHNLQLNISQYKKELEKQLRTNATIHPFPPFIF